MDLSLSQIWDMDDVSPLFRVPSCVFFAEKYEKKTTPINGLPGLKFSGKLTEHNCNLQTANDKLKETDAKWYYVKQGQSSAISSKKSRAIQLENPYKDLFKNGATIYPRAFYFIDIDQIEPKDFEDRIINIKTSEAIEADAKKPWKGLKFTGKIESKFIFRTALAKSILPFALYKPDLVVLPMLIEKNNVGEKEIKLLSAKDLMQGGYLNASKWFRIVENTWNSMRTEKNAKIYSQDYLNWQNKLIDQNLDSRYLVVYNSSAKDANAVVIDRENHTCNFIIENKTYCFYCANIKEAQYVSAILNSKLPNELMKDFQSRGLFGARDVHKKILDIYFPRFDENNETHIKLVELSETAHTKAKKYLEDKFRKKN